MRNPFSRDTFGQALDPSAYGLGQTATTGAPDERVRRALVEAEYPYKLTPAHNFTVLVDYRAEGRTQQVLIDSATRTVRRRDWRRVYSWAYLTPGRLTLDQALELLDELSVPTLGSWFVSEENGQTWVGFHIRVPADAPSAEQDAAILTVAEVADGMEKATVGTDNN